MKNFRWLFFEKIINFVNAIFVIFFLTNYLGVEKFGEYSYVISFVTIFSFLASFGLDAIIVKEVVNNKIETNILITNSIVLLTISSVLTYLFVLLIASFVVNESIFKNISLYGLVLLIYPIEIFYHYLNAKLDLKNISKIKSLINIFGIFMKLMAIKNNGDVVDFFIIEIVIISSSSIMAVYLALKKNIKLQKFIDFDVLTFLFKSGLPLLISSGAILIYIRADILMIEYFLGLEKTGIYATSLRISQIWYVLPMTLTTILFPHILNCKKINHNEYEKSLSLSTQIQFLICASFSIGTMITAPVVINNFFSKEYIESITIIMFLSLSGPLVGLGYINGRYFVAENLLYLSMLRNIHGVLINIILNLLLIPKYGLLGASTSTFISVLYTNILCLKFNKKTEKIFYLQIKSIYQLFNVKNLINLKNKLSEIIK